MVWVGPSIRPATPDPVLAELAAKHGIKPQRSDILATDFFAMAFAPRGFVGQQRVVDLSCGHKALTRNWRTMSCPRCAEMIRQGHDYEGWINNRHHAYDGMIWREDPMRHFNERTDLGGAFIDD